MKKMSPVSVDSIQFNGLLGEGLRKTVATRLNAAMIFMIFFSFSLKVSYEFNAKKPRP